MKLLLSWVENMEHYPAQIAIAENQKKKLKSQKTHLSFSHRANALVVMRTPKNMAERLMIAQKSA
tara:strand:- start:59 stop:253 length:195 start_codon:yes stop_codon:yes gene_type:complete